MDGKAKARRTAEILFSIGAVHFDARNPFTFTSGRRSPVYIDCRRLISHLAERRAVVSMACDLLAASCDLDAVDCVAGGETAGIAWAAWLSEALDKPMLYVRKKPKDFARGAQIEGDLRPGARVLLAEDLTTDGGSKIAFAAALRDAGARVDDVFSVFRYGIFPAGDAALAQAGLRLHALADWRDMLDHARTGALFPPATLAAVEDFLRAPEDWAVQGCTAQA